MNVDRAESHPLYISPTPSYDISNYSDYQKGVSSHLGAPTTPPSRPSLDSNADSVVSAADTRGKARFPPDSSPASPANAHDSQLHDPTRPTPRGAIISAMPHWTVLSLRQGSMMQQGVAALSRHGR